MNISEFCIRRPVFTILLMASLLVGGIAGYAQLPVSALPRVDYPTITVSASLPGASPETMASSVATPLERQFSTIAGVDSMSSTSSLGSTNITLQFDLARDIDGAALDVQTAISAASRKMPPEMTSPPSFRKVNPADAPVLFIAVSSDSLPITQVNEYADTVLAQRLSTVTGVAQVQIYGERKYAVRVKVDPGRLAAQGLAFSDVRDAVAAAASNTPVGLISGPRQLFNLEVAGAPASAAGFQDLIVTWKNGAPVRLRDLAAVTDGVENERSDAALDGKPAVILAIQRQPDANTIDVVRRVRDLLPTFRQQLPPSVELTPLLDRSIGIEHSVRDVERTMGITICLVIAVIFLFLRDARATLIPTLAVPLSLIATFGAMALLGFSIDNISLLALTLSVGFVVDDAIVMLENIVRHVENGRKPLDAAILGAKEIGFTIISITLSLVAVFIPVLFMGGVVGRVLNEFAVTISIAILLSGFISLTLTPMLAARLAHKHEARPSSLFAWVVGRYDSSLQWALRHKRTMLLLTLATIAGSVYAFAIIPKGFFPVEDTGFIRGSTEAAQDASYDAMLDKQKRLAAIIGADPAVENVFYAVGGGGGGSSNSGRLNIALKPRAERDTMEKVIGRLRKKAAEVEGLGLYMQPVQNIQIGGRQSKSMYQYTLTGSDLQQLYATTNKLAEELQKVPGFLDVTTDLQLKSLQARVTPDRDKASSYGITDEALREGLYSAFGDLRAGSLYTPSNDYEIVLGVTDEAKQSPEDLARLYLRGSGGQLVPLSAVASVTRAEGPLSVNHQGQMPAVTLSFNLAEGVALGDAVREIDRIGLPDGVTGAFQGNAQVFQDAARGQGLLIGITLLVIYIILGMLYESFRHPLTILSGLPAAGIGAIGALMLARMDLSIIAIVGVILLIGIVKKNAIMMVDFAVEARSAGKTPEEAIHEACLLRFRPIMMTTFAALFGSLPVALAIGEGAELRQPLGVTVVGGLLTSQLLTLYITPVIYLYLENMRFKKKTVE